MGPLTDTEMAFIDLLHIWIEDEYDKIKILESQSLIKCPCKNLNIQKHRSTISQINSIIESALKYKD